MAASSEEWELSKENIRPIQQGRKQKALKVALASHPEDVILQQRQLYENELRTYSGDDPLSVWCRYIKWVEQNFPKGGREGHIKILIERCLSILKDEKRYYDDERYIDVMLKYANISEKPIDVYDYMFGNNIGCKSAKFFTNWSWEMEQLGNVKKADEILIEGIRRKAEPFEKLCSYQKDFEIRLATKIKANTEASTFELDSGRSAFAMLKPQKKNLAPILRTGEAVIDNRKTSLILGRQQPLPKSSNTSSKVPFKIYNSENINPSLPVQSQSMVPNSLNTENYKENERKPSKWSKVKVKPHGLYSKTVNETKPGFQFHCDEESEQKIPSPRSVPKTSKILSTHCRSPSPVMALFEPPDPLRRYVYPQNKVYGGAKEFSLEEIRAAEWFENQKKIEQDMLLSEQQKKIEEHKKTEEELKIKVEYLSKQVELLQSHLTTSAPKLCKLSCATDMNTDPKYLENVPTKSIGSNKIYNNEENRGKLLKKNHAQQAENKLQNADSTQMKQNVDNILPFKGILSNNSQYNLSAAFQNKVTDSVGYYEAAKMVEELYNRTLSQSINEGECKLNINNELNEKSVTISSTNLSKLNEPKKHEEIENSISKKSNDNLFTFYHDPTGIISDSNEVVSTKETVNKEDPFVLHIELNEPKKHEEIENSISKKSNDNLFTFYHDPTGVISDSNKVVSTKETVNKEDPFVLYTELNEPKKHEEIENSISKKSNDNLFTFYHDPTGIISDPNEVVSTKETVNKEDLFVLHNEESSEEDAENIPPKGYVQDTTKRELTGILEPSKNILFIPLKEQEEMDDDSDIGEEYICHNGGQYSEETIVLPSNTEQFSTAKFLASTPYVAKNKSPILEKSVHQIEGSEARDEPQNQCLAIGLHSIKNNFESDQDAVMRKESKSSTEHNSLPRFQNMLSVIMETSTDSRSKSSSSSSASLTRSNNLDQFSNPHISVYKHCSKLDTCEPSALSSVSEISDDISSLNFINSSVIPHREIEKDQKVQLYSVEFDPFDQELTSKFLTSINMSNYKTLYNIDKSLKGVIKAGENIQIGNESYIIEFLIAEGAYAKVYEAAKSNFGLRTDKRIALKVCKNANEWEFYICKELQRRLSGNKFLPDVRNSVMDITSAVKYSDGIILATEYSSLGTLLDIINFYKKQNSAIPEVMIMYFTREILLIISKLHECNIIHGDIKPDNFLLVNNAFDKNSVEKLFETTTSLRLIDFGRAIDLSLYDKGICFTSIFNKTHFKCNEMKDKKPWVFQLDWYAVVSCIHTMLFSDYMVVRKKNEVWGIEQKFKRYWCTSLWEPLFNKLLNIPECYQEPDLESFISVIESKLKLNSHNFISQLTRFGTAFAGRKKNS